MGDRHHLHPNARGLVVLGGGAGPVLKDDRGLGDAIDHAYGSGVAGVDDGGMATQAASGSARPLHQGTQFTEHDWQDFLKAHGLVSSMSRRRNCHDNAVAESFFQLLKRERVKRRVYVTREEAKSDVFNYIEMFYNTRRQHGHNDGLSPVEYEKQQSK